MLIEAIKFKKRILLILLTSIVCVVGVLFSNELQASESEKARIYRTPDERREAGLVTELNEWLAFSGLLEVEKEYFEENLKNNKKNREYGNTTPTVQFGLELNFTEWFGSEIVYEVEHDGDKHTARMDEAFVYLDFDEIGLGVEVGKLSIPFGEYYSHFITGPLLEFGETIRNGLIIDYSFFEKFEVSAFVIDSDSEKLDRNTEYDWGVNFEFVSMAESIRFGIGYLSDLSESDERFLRDENNIYQNRVDALNVYALLGINHFEITAEHVTALRHFREFEKQEDKPSAFNIELAYFYNPLIQFSLRYEESHEYSDEPKNQYGISTTWRPKDRVSVTAEYLYGKFEKSFVFDDEDRELEDRNLFAAQFSIEF